MGFSNYDLSLSPPSKTVEKIWQDSASNKPPTILGLRQSFPLLDIHNQVLYRGNGKPIYIYFTDRYNMILQFHGNSDEISTLNKNSKIHYFIKKGGNLSVQGFLEQISGYNIKFSDLRDQHSDIVDARYSPPKITEIGV